MNRIELIFSLTKPSLWELYFMNYTACIYVQDSEYYLIIVLPKILQVRLSSIISIFP